MKNLSPLTDYTHRVCSDPDLVEVQSVVCEMHASGEPSLLNRGFEELLLEAVDEGLAWLGDSAGRMIYYHLENDFNIRRQDIPCKIERFADAVEEILGVAAALLEIQIMKGLHCKVGDSFRYSPEQKDFVFTQYIEAIRRSYLNRLV